MSYANFKSTLKKVNIKPKGVKEIVLEINDDSLINQFENIAEMVDTPVRVSLESDIVVYDLEINKETQEPVTKYTFEDNKIVEKKEEYEQLELEGLPPAKIETEKKEMVVDKQTIDDFILSDLSPTYDDLNENIIEIIQRQIKGETYLKLASEFSMNSGQIVEEAEKYRQRVAQYAVSYKEWKESKAKGGEE